MFKRFINTILIISAILTFGLKASAEQWVSSNNNLGNVIYVDIDSIQQKDNRIFYNVKYYEEKINNDSKVLIMSEGNHPFVIGDPIAYKNIFFMKSIQSVNDRVMNYVKYNSIPEVQPGSDLDSIPVNLDPYAKNVIAKIKSNLKYKRKYRNSSARAMIKINQNGELKKVHVYESSGNKKLDMALNNAIEASAPFDPLPEEYDKTYAILWIDVNYGKDKSVILLNSIISLGKMILR